jgi:hypothetical protein
VNHRFSPGIHVFGLDKDGVGYAMDEYNKDLISPGSNSGSRSREEEDHRRRD